MQIAFKYFATLLHAETDTILLYYYVYDQKIIMLFTIQVKLLSALTHIHTS